MTADRVEKLESLGFNWEPHDEQWERVWGLLRKDTGVHGNRVIPDKYRVGGVDSEVMGAKAKKGLQGFTKRIFFTHDLKRLEKLKKIDFDFGPIETKWNDNLGLARQYREMHGNLNIQKSYSLSGINLGSWLQRQVHY